MHTVLQNCLTATGHIFTSFIKCPFAALLSPLQVPCDFEATWIRSIALLWPCWEQWIKKYAFHFVNLQAFTV
jgi:hypothetical protein